MKEIKIILVYFAFGLKWQNGFCTSDLTPLVLDSSDFESILHPPSFLELAARYGHPAEAHDVITEDGYILTLFHIPGTRPAPPVLLFHGILDSADTWIIRGNTSLAITLAEANYDVWLGNVRGNRYSRRHVTLNPDVDAEFWNFSFDEHGLYDLPAVIDQILNRTSAEKINMFGHSQGNVMIWVLLSSRPEYNEKFNVATALAPICYMDHIVPPVSILMRLLPQIGELLLKFGVTNVLGDNSLETFAFRVVARVPVIGYAIDTGILFGLFGADYTELEPSFLPTVTLHVPTWTSVKNLIHYGQLATRGIFSRYDYGEAGNLLAYNSSVPPVYQFGNVSAKVVLLAALNDNLSQIVDVNKLRAQLPNVVQYTINPRLVMNHIDYIWGRTAQDYLYPYIFNILDTYQ